jgi:hypothetical protein
MINGRCVVRRCVCGPRLNRGGGKVIQLQQIEFCTPRVITAVWRTILIVGIVWRVVRRVIVVARVADGKNGNGNSDDDEGGTAEDRHDRRVVDKGA